MQFSPHTISNKKRFYLVKVQKTRDENIITTDMVKQIISTNFSTLFGSTELSKFNYQVNQFNSNEFVISVDSKSSVSLRSVLILPPSHPFISSFFILSEASTLQSIYHDSRLYFESLV